MIRTTSRLVALATMVTVAGCGAPQSPRTSSATVATASHAAPLGPEVIQALYSSPHREDGVVLQGAHAGTRWTKWTKADGSLELTAAHGLFADTGRFVVKGDQVCSSWEHIDNGKPGCVQLLRVGSNEYVTVRADGSEGSRFRVSAP